jgi:SNF2 family DNA or RNA helicase
LDWVPAALLQAEDRIHRVGQKKNCQVIQLIAKIEDDEENLDHMMVELLNDKAALIGSVLDESTGNIIQGSIQSKIFKRLISYRCHSSNKHSTVITT